jgi:hypothetical protein
MKVRGLFLIHLHLHPVEYVSLLHRASPLPPAGEGEATDFNRVMVLVTIEARARANFQQIRCALLILK